MFDLINRPLSFKGNLLEPDPYQNCTPNVVADNSGLSALATFQSGQLFGFSVKLLNFPAQATHFLYGLRVVLSKIVGNDIVRALSRQHHPEQFHLMFFRKALEFHNFAMLFFSIRPLQPIYTAVRS